jgi:hypothetical protein
MLRQAVLLPDTRKKSRQLKKGLTGTMKTMI